MKNVKPAELTSYTWLFWVGLGVHLLMEGVFIYLGEPLMTVYNLVSIAVFGWGVYYHRRNEWLAALVCFVEPTIFSVLGILSMGWSAGIQNWLLALCILALVVPFKRRRPFYILAMVNATLYLVLFLLKGPPSQGMEVVEQFFVTGNILIPLVIFFVAERIMNWSKSVEEFTLRQKIDRMEEIIDVDELTGLTTRRKMKAMLEALDGRGEGWERDFYIIFVDIDHFKNINDTYGHDVGDLVLQRVAAILERELRHSDTVARWGGEEFVVLMQSEDAHRPLPIEAVLQSLQRVRRAIENEEMAVGGHTLRVTATFGGTGSRGMLNTTDMLACADRRMYMGKKNGRNCVVVQ